MDLNSLIEQAILLTLEDRTLLLAALVPTPQTTTVLSMADNMQEGVSLQVAVEGYDAVPSSEPRTQSTIESTAVVESVREQLDKGAGSSAVSQASTPIPIRASTPINPEVGLHVNMDFGPPLHEMIDQALQSLWAGHETHTSVPQESHVSHEMTATSLPMVSLRQEPDLDGVTVNVDDVDHVSGDTADRVGTDHVNRPDSADASTISHGKVSTSQDNIPTRQELQVLYTHSGGSQPVTPSSLSHQAEFSGERPGRTLSLGRNSTSCLRSRHRSALRDPCHGNEDVSQSTCRKARSRSRSRTRLTAAGVLSATADENLGFSPPQGTKPMIVTGIARFRQYVRADRTSARGRAPVWFGGVEYYECEQMLDEFTFDIEQRHDEGCGALTYGYDFNRPILVVDGRDTSVNNNRWFEQRMKRIVEDYLNTSPTWLRIVTYISLSMVRDMTKDDPGYGDWSDMCTYTSGTPTDGKMHNWRLIPVAGVERLHLETYMVPAQSGHCVLDSLKKWVDLEEAAHEKPVVLQRAFGDLENSAWLLKGMTLEEANEAGVPIKPVAQLFALMFNSLYVIGAAGEIMFKQCHSAEHCHELEKPIQIDDALRERWRQFMLNGAMRPGQPRGKLYQKTWGKYLDTFHNLKPQPAPRDRTGRKKKTEGHHVCVLRAANHHTELVTGEARTHVMASYEQSRGRKSGQGTITHTRKMDSENTFGLKFARRPTEGENSTSPEQVRAIIALADNPVDAPEDGDIYDDGIFHTFSAPIEEWEDLASKHNRVVVHMTKQPHKNPIPLTTKSKEVCEPGSSQTCWVKTQCLRETVLRIAKFMEAFPRHLTTVTKNKGHFEGLGCITEQKITRIKLDDNYAQDPAKRISFDIVVSPDAMDDMAVALELGAYGHVNPTITSLVTPWFAEFQPGVPASEYTETTDRIIRMNPTISRAFIAVFTDHGGKLRESVDYDLAKNYPMAILRLAERGVMFPVFAIADEPEPYDCSHAIDPETGKMCPGIYYVVIHDHSRYFPYRPGGQWLYHESVQNIREQCTTGTYTIETMVLAQSGVPAQLLADFIREIFRRFGPRLGKKIAVTWIGQLALDLTSVTVRSQLIGSRQWAHATAREWEKTDDTIQAAVCPMNFDLDENDTRQVHLVTARKDVRVPSSHTPIYTMIVEEGNRATYEMAAEVLGIEPRNHTKVMKNIVQINTDCVWLLKSAIMKRVNTAAYREIISRQCPIDFGDGENYLAIKVGKTNNPPGDTFEVSRQELWGPPPAGQPIPPGVIYRSFTRADSLKCYDPNRDPIGDWKRHVVYNAVTKEAYEVTRDGKRICMPINITEVEPLPISVDEILQNGGVIVTGPSGSGKSFGAVKGIHRVLKRRQLVGAIVAHTNKVAAQNSGQTTCKGLGVPGPKARLSLEKVYAIGNKLDYVILDEAYQSPYLTYVLLYRLRIKFPKLCIILVGDRNQTEAVEQLQHLQGLDLVTGSLGKRIAGNMLIQFEGSFRFKDCPRMQALAKFLLTPEGKAMKDLSVLQSKFPELFKPPPESRETHMISCTNRDRRHINEVKMGDL